MMSYLSAGAALLAATAAGEGLLLLLRVDASRDGPAGRAVAAFAAGIGLVATWSFLLALLGVPASAFLLAAPLLLYPAGRIFSRGGGGKGGRGGPRAGRTLPGTIALLAAAAQILYVFRHALLRPVHGWDAWRIWSFRARVLFLERGFTDDFFARDWAGFPGYPLGIPFVEAFLAHAIGFWHGPAVKMLFPLFFSGMLYHVARALAERSAPGRWPIGLLLAASAPLVVHHGTIAYMDLPLAFYLLGSVLYLARWEAGGKRSPLLVAALFAGFLPQIKNEGFPFYLLLTLVVLFLARRATRPVRDLRLWFAASLPFSLPWLLFKYAGGVPESPYHLVAFGGIGPAAARFLTFLRLALENMFLTGNWGIAWFPLLFLLFPRRGRPVTVYTIVLASGFVLFAAAYSFTGSYAFLMNGTSLGRNLVVLLPLAIVAGVGSLTGKKAPRPGGPPAGREEPVGAGRS